MRTKRSLLILLLAALVSPACEENAVQDISAPPAGSARIKFFNFGVGAPAVNFYANDTKITAVSSTTNTESTAGVAYGSVGAGGNYTAMQAGQYTLSGRIAAATDKDLPISNLGATIGDGKYYSFYQSGVYNTATKSVDSFIIEDSFIPNIDYTVAYVRFVNAVYNAEPMALQVTERTSGLQVAVGGAVAYKSGGAFAAVPGGVYDLVTRYAGSNNDVMTRASVSFAPGRVYTIAARGDLTVSSSLLLDNTLNR